MDETRRQMLANAALAMLILGGIAEGVGAQEMDKMWGERVVKLKAVDAASGR